MVGDQIRKYRISQDITQTKLAQKMGISRQTLSKIETNKQPATEDMIHRAAEALHVNYHVLIESDMVHNGNYDDYQCKDYDHKPKDGFDKLVFLEDCVGQHKQR